MEQALRCMKSRVLYLLEEIGKGLRMVELLDLGLMLRPFCFTWRVTIGRHFRNMQRGCWHWIARSRIKKLISLNNCYGWVEYFVQGI